MKQDLRIRRQAQKQKKIKKIFKMHEIKKVPSSIGSSNVTLYAYLLIYMRCHVHTIIGARSPRLSRGKQAMYDL